MSDPTILDRTKAVVEAWAAFKEQPDNVEAVASCLRTLCSTKSDAEKWVSLTRAVNRSSDPAKVVGIMESLVAK